MLGAPLRLITRHSLAHTRTATTHRTLRIRARTQMQPQKHVKQYYDSLYTPDTVPAYSSTTVFPDVGHQLDSLLVDMAEGRSSSQWRSSFNNKRMAFVHATTSPPSDYDSPYESTPPPSTAQHQRTPAPVFSSPPVHRPMTNGGSLPHRSTMSDFWRGVVQSDDMTTRPMEPGTDYSRSTLPNRVPPTTTRPEYSNAGHSVLDEVSSLLQQTADMLDSPQGAMVAQDTANTLQHMHTNNARGWRAGGRAQHTVPHRPSDTVSPPHTVPHRAQMPHQSLNVVTEDTVYRTKPIVQVNLSIPSARPKVCHFWILPNLWGV